MKFSPSVQAEPWAASPGIWSPASCCRGPGFWGIPAGTLAVNAGGSLLIGLLMRALAGSPLLWLLTVGFCGGFTTFSTFSAELVAMLRAGNYPGQRGSMPY